MTTMAAEARPVANAQSLGSLLILGSIVSAQTGATIAAQLFVDVPPAAVVYVRQLIAGLVLVAVARPNLRGLDRRVLLTIAPFAVIMAVMNLSFYEAVHRLPLALAVTIELTGPLALTVALSRRLSDLLWSGVAIAGVLVMRLDSLNGDGVSAAGVALALLAAAGWASYILMSRRLGSVTAGVGGLGLGLVASSFVTLPFAVHSGFGRAVDHPLQLALVALLGGLIVFSLELRALRLVSARSAALFLCMSPVVAALVARIRLDQSLSPMQWAGMALVIASSAATSVAASTSRPD
jgi:inner membrane transporter RhtA